MSQHFLLSARCRSLSIAQVMRMSDEEALKPLSSRSGGRRPTVSPSAQVADALSVMKLAVRTVLCAGAARLAEADFTVTSGTLFASHKLPLRRYLAAIAIFMNEVKGKSALALSRDLGVQYKTAFVLAHKMREALASEMKRSRLGGTGKEVEIDGAYFGGHVKPANEKPNWKDRRLSENQTGKRQCVVVIRQRDGRTLPNAFGSEVEALSFIRQRVAKGTEISADESSAWNDLHSSYVVKPINHQFFRIA